MKRLHAVRPDLVGIALSGFGMEEDIRRSREAGFVQHLTVSVRLLCECASVYMIIISPCL